VRVTVPPRRDRFARGRQNRSSGLAEEVYDVGERNAAARSLHAVPLPALLAPMQPHVTLLPASSNDC